MGGGYVSAGCTYGNRRASDAERVEDKKVSSIFGELEMCFCDLVRCDMFPVTVV